MVQLSKTTLNIVTKSLERILAECCKKSQFGSSPTALAYCQRLKVYKQQLTSSKGAWLREPPREDKLAATGQTEGAWLREPHCDHQLWHGKLHQVSLTQV